MNLYQETFLPSTLHDIAMGLLIPTMVLIIFLILISMYFIGQVIVDFFTERRHFRQNIPSIINDINKEGYEGITAVLMKARLLQYQKAALIMVSENMGLSEEMLFALAQSEVNGTEKHYKRRLAWTDVISKVAPMLGLMGTLIPLGPGIVSLGQGDTLALSQSLLVAFDATICGLVCAVASLIVSKIRSGWYTEYLNVLESIMSCVIDKAALARTEGVMLPSGYRGDAVSSITGSKKRAVKAAQRKTDGRGPVDRGNRPYEKGNTHG